MSAYKNEHNAARQNPDEFWLNQANALDWFQSPTIGFKQDEFGNDRWFPDGVLNSAHLALDVHVNAGKGAQTALIYDSPLDNTVQSFTYAELLDDVQKCAGMLHSLGVEKGDRVVLYMPMIPQAAIGMLACARLGAIHSVVFGGFAAKELAVRIDDAAPKVILSATCGLEVNKQIAYQPLLRDALGISEHTPNNVVIWERPQVALDPSFTSWQSLMESAPHADCVSVKATDPLYILYTSGTTGKPKGVVRDNGGHAVAMHYSMSALYDVGPGDTFWAASDVGWVVGHSYIVYAPLMAGCTSVLYEGKPVGTPDAGAFWRVVEEHNVSVLFAAPTAFRAIKKTDPSGDQIRKYNIDSLKTIFMAGERLDPPTLEWTQEKTGKPVVDHWWQTETGWAIAGKPVGH